MRQNRNYAIRLQDISEALTKSGYTKLDQQAMHSWFMLKTAWTIMKQNTSSAGCYSETTDSMLANPETPPAVRNLLLQKYLSEV